VPADLSVVGYDDVPPAQWSSPPLTTVHQPLRHMAQEATRMLFRPDVPGRAAPRIALATHLVVRQSTASRV
jgi:LacI family xylobiose transport system transcriptional regulator